MTGLGALAFGLALLIAPAIKTSSPAMATLYAMAPRHTWGVIFLGLAALAVWGALKPSEESFVIILSIEVFAQASWALGLTIPSFTEGQVGNILAPIAWLQLAGTALVVAVSGKRPVLPPSTRNRRRTDAVK